MKKIEVSSNPVITGFDQNYLPYVLTIIIPVYQRTLYLPHLLNSIAESFNVLNPSPVQTRPLQCIIMDDAGPEPATQWILKKIISGWSQINQTLIHVFYHQHKEYQGTSKNIEMGINLSSGKWILICHDDDLVDRNFFSSVYSLLLAKNNNALILYDYIKQPSLPVEFHIQTPLSKQERISCTTINKTEIALPNLKKYFPRLTHTFLCQHLLSKSLKLTTGKITDNQLSGLISFIQHKKYQVVRLTHPLVYYCGS